MDLDCVRAMAREQDDVCSREQLATIGVRASHMRANVAAGRWNVIPPAAVVLHNGPLTVQQRRWVALLNGGPWAALCGLTALAVDGLTGWERDTVHIVVPRGAGIVSAPGVRVHESRRFDPDLDVHPGRRPPRTRPARSAIDAAAWSRSPRAAVGVLAAVVQQGLARAWELSEELDRAGRVRHRRLLARAVEDIAGGARALSEIDFARLCRRHGLPEPVRQALRLEPSGRRRYLDAEWVLADGRRVVAEVDGAVHLLPRSYWADMERANGLVLDGRLVLRFAAFALRAHPRNVADQLAQVLTGAHLSDRR